MAGNSNEPTSRLLALIGEDRLKRIMSEFHAATKATVMVMAENVRDVGFPSGDPPDTATSLCRDLIQNNCGKREVCKKLDREAAERASQQTEPWVYECPLSGLWEFCVAVRANGGEGPDGVLGYLFGGQVADAQKMKTDLYIQKAKDLGVSTQEFLKHLEKSPAYTEKEVRAYARLLGVLANDLSELAREHDQEQARAEAFHRAAAAIVSGPGLRLKDVLESILSEVDRVLAPDEATVWLVDRENPNRLIAAHTHRGLPTHMPEGETPFFTLSGSHKDMGVIGRIAAGTFDERVDDLQAHPDDLKYPDQVARMGTRSHMAMRLPSEGPLLGVFEVGSKKEGRYTDQDLKLLKILGNDIAAAIHNAQLYEDLQHQQARVVPEREHEIARLQTLLAMDEAFASGVDEVGVLKLLLRHTLSLLRRDFEAYGHVRRVDVETGEGAVLQSEGSFGPGSQVVPPVRAPDDPLTGKATRPGVLLYLPDVAQSEEFLAERASLSDEAKELYDRVKSLLVFPVRCGDRVGGHLVLYRAEPGGFDDTAIETVRLLCERAGIALTGAAERRRVRQIADLRGRLETNGARLSILEGRDETIRAACQNARDVLGSEYALMFCLLPILEEGYLVVREISAPPGYPVLTPDKNVVGAKIPLSEALNAALETGEVLEVDTSNDVRYQFLLPGTRRALLGPMRYRYGEIFEGLIVAESRAPQPFTELQREAMKLIGSQSAVHVARSRALAEDYAAFTHHFSRPMSSLRAFLWRCEEMAREGTLPQDLAQIANDATGTLDHFDAHRVALGQLRDLHPERVTIGALVDGAITSARREAGTRDINAAYEGDCGSLEIEVDVAAVRGALLELIYNAITNDPAGGAINIKCTVVEGSCSIEVWDHGPAISDEQAAHLFDLRTPIGGPGEKAPGMGLWMVRTIVEAHGGAVDPHPTGQSPKAFVVTLPSGG